MGQAAINAKLNKAKAEQLKNINLEQIGNLIVEASKGVHTEKYGACILFAEEGVRILNSLGIDAEFVAGDAMFCVNNTGKGFVAHNSGGLRTAKKGMFIDADFNGHCWIRVGHKLIDFSVCEIPKKVRAMVAHDNIATPIDEEYGHVYTCPVQDIPTESKLIEDNTPHTAHYRANPVAIANARRIINHSECIAEGEISIVVNKVLEQL